MTYSSKEDMVARMSEIQEEIAVLEMKDLRTPEEETQYRELLMEFGSLDTTLKAMDGKNNI